MRNLLVVCAGALLMMLSCTGKEMTKEDLAALAAKSYYDSLMAGGYAYYVDGFNDTDSLPPHYREQLIVNAKQFVLGQKEAHKGVERVRIINAETDTVTKVTNVFLALCFSDSITEEIVVPMVEKGGEWKMR